MSFYTIKVNGDLYKLSSLSYAGCYIHDMNDILVGNVYSFNECRSYEYHVYNREGMIVSHGDIPKCHNDIIKAIIWVAGVTTWLQYH